MATATPAASLSASSTISALSNVTNDTSTPYVDQWNYEWNFAFSVALAAALSVTAFLAVVGNSMVLTVVIRHRGMRTRTNLFLVNLAVADLMVGAAVMPFAVTTLIEGRWVFGSDTGAFCTINGWLNCFCLVASIHTLMYISIHKYFSITQPLSSHFQLRQILGMMAAAWVWAAVSSTITVTGLSSVRYKLGTSQCGPNYPDGLKSYFFHAIIQVTNIFTPVIILTYCYTRMFREIRAHSRRLQQNSTLEQDIILAQQKNVTITLFIVLAAFVICALPFHLYATYTTIQKDKHFSPYLNPLAYATLYLNSALNPIIYAFRSPSFREGYKEILCQTPTYVISDGSATDNPASPFRQRFSSLFGPRRKSSLMSGLTQHRPSCTSTNGFPHGLTLGSKKQGLARQMRNSRCSRKESSVIEQNGDMIFIKNGKIVSIRRQGSFTGLYDSSPLLRCTPLLYRGAGGLGVNGPILEKGSGTCKGGLAVLPPEGRGSIHSEGSDEVFVDTCNRDRSPSVRVSSAQYDINDNRRLLSQTGDSHGVSAAADNGVVDSEAVNGAAVGGTVTNSERDGSAVKPGVGIIVHISEDDILEVVPLTPGTRDRITRSNTFLGSQNPSDSLAAPAPSIKVSRSMQGLHNRSLRRLPSVERLDPPGSLKRSSSDYDISHALLGLSLLAPFIHHRRWSVGRGQEVDSPPL